MHFSFLGQYWWVVLGLFAIILVGYVFIAGRHAEGGVRARAGLGWTKWRALSKKAGELQARIILTLFYFSLAAPFGLARTFLADPLRVKKSGHGSAWRERQTRDLSLDDARRQY